MNPFWRNLALTIVLAGLAGAAGGYFSAERASESRPLTIPLRESVEDVMRSGFDLNAEQKRAVKEISDRYYARRGALREKIVAANKRLADELVADMAFGAAAQVASKDVQDRLSEMQNLTIRYILELRDVLNPEQRSVYDRKIRQALSVQ